MKKGSGAWAHSHSTFRRLRKCDLSHAMEVVCYQQLIGDMKSGMFRQTLPKWVAWLCSLYLAGNFQAAKR